MIFGAAEQVRAGERLRGPKNRSVSICLPSPATRSVEAQNLCVDAHNTHVAHASKLATNV